MHYSQFKVKDSIVRTMNRQQYKEASRYCRVVRNIVEDKLPIEVARQAADDTMIYGESCLVIPDEGQAYRVKPSGIRLHHTHSVHCKQRTQGEAV